MTKTPLKLVSVLLIAALSMLPQGSCGDPKPCDKHHAYKKSDAEECKRLFDDNKRILNKLKDYEFTIKRKLDSELKLLDRVRHTLSTLYIQNNSSDTFNQVHYKNLSWYGKIRGALNNKMGLANYINNLLDNKIVILSGGLPTHTRAEKESFECKCGNGSTTLKCEITIRKLRDLDNRYKKTQAELTDNLDELKQGCHDLITSIDQSLLNMYYFYKDFERSLSAEQITMLNKKFGKLIDPETLTTCYGPNTSSTASADGKKLDASSSTLEDASAKPNDVSATGDLSAGAGTSTAKASTESSTATSSGEEQKSEEAAGSAKVPGASEVNAGASTSEPVSHPLTSTEVEPTSLTSIPPPPPEPFVKKDEKSEALINKKFNSISSEIREFFKSRSPTSEDSAGNTPVAHGEVTTPGEAATATSTSGDAHESGRVEKLIEEVKTETTEVPSDVTAVEVNSTVVSSEEPKPVEDQPNTLSDQSSGSHSEESSLTGDTYISEETSDDESDSVFEHQTLNRSSSGESSVDHVVPYYQLKKSVVGSLYALTDNKILPFIYALKDKLTQMVTHKNSPAPTTENTTAEGSDTSSPAATPKAEKKEDRTEEIIEELDSLAEDLVLSVNETENVEDSLDNVKEIVKTVCELERETESVSGEADISSDSSSEGDVGDVKGTLVTDDKPTVVEPTIAKDEGWGVGKWFSWMFSGIPRVFKPANTADKSETQALAKTNSTTPHRKESISCEEILGDLTEISEIYKSGSETGNSIVSDSSDTSQVSPVTTEKEDPKILEVDPKSGAADLKTDEETKEPKKTGDEKSGPMNSPSAEKTHRKKTNVNKNIDKLIKKLTVETSKESTSTSKGNKPTTKDKKEDKTNLTGTPKTIIKVTLLSSELVNDGFITNSLAMIALITIYNLMN